LITAIDSEVAGAHKGVCLVVDPGTGMAWHPRKR
jgi:hypothetical protein